MTEPEQITSFCGKVEAKENGELTLLKINDLEGTWHKPRLTPEQWEWMRYSSRTVRP